MKKDDESSPSTSRNRSRRTRVDKTGRVDALERLRNARAGGSKNKYEVRELENVYDVVDESTYSKKVHDRQKDDWIVDDGAGEYVEDGREIFDDDLIDHEEDKGRKKPKNKKEKAAKKEEKETQRVGFLNLRDMLSAMPVKRKRSELTSLSSDSPQLNEDNLLGALMKELHEDKRPKISSRTPDLLQGAISEDEAVEVPRRPPPIPRTPDFHQGAISEDEVVELPRTPPTRPRPIARQSIPKRHLLPKKKFVPFGSVKLEPTVFTSNSSNYCDENPLDNMDTLEFSTSQAPPIRNKSSSSYENGIQTSVTVPPPPTNETLKSKTQTPEKQKPVEKIEKKRKIENFESYGQICNANGSSTTTFSDDNPQLIEDGDSEDTKILNFFWLDMFEEPKNPGFLYLFGKVQSAPKTYTSACVVVKDLMRCVYLLIRETMKSSDEEVVGSDTYNEFHQVIAPKFKINEFKSRPVKKKYCFDLIDVPSVGNYIEVRYSGTLPPLPADLNGETFSRVFGTGTPLMETFLLEKKLKGPSWLQIRNPERVEHTQQQHSWAKMEFISGVGAVRLNERNSEMSVPPLVLASLNIQATSDGASKKDTIVFMGVAVHKTFELQVPLKPNQLYHDYFCLVNKPPGEIWPLDVDKVFSKENSTKKAMKMDSERAMLGCFLAKLQQIDADVYLGHDLNFDLLLLHLLNLKVPHWSRIGRLKRTSAIGKNSKTLDYKSALAGRLFCDVKISAMELIRARSYDFQNLVQQVLGTQTESLTGPQMKELFDSANGLEYLINWGMQHCVLNIRLVNELQVMPLALQITAIAGNTLFRTLLGGRSERNEYLLLHAFHSKDFIVPDKYRPFIKDEKSEGDGNKKKNSGPSYAGGMVLDPKKGFYDNFIVLMDFNSLYPSIIQEFNICFTTRTSSRETGAEDVEKGILPEEIRKLVESRRQVKGLMKGPSVSQEQMRVYDIRQMALKLTANSMYGCLGFKNSRFYAKELAALTTGYGREILLKTKDAVERMGYEVIYGDTDSLMINSNTKDIQKVYTIGNTIKTEINKMYKLLELELDGIFRFLLLLKKKKYAALVWNQKPDGKSETSLELKGLDMVRRDWAPIASNTARFVHPIRTYRGSQSEKEKSRLVLDEIMSEQSLDEKVFKICRILNEIAGKLGSGDIVLKDLLITKQLAKNPEEYKESQGLYHVKVAVRMNKSGSLNKKFKNGDTVSYLFCTDGEPHHLSELSVSSVKKSGDGEEKVVSLEPDPKYYLAHQIHPVVSRICEPIEGLDASRIAEALGMDGNAFKRRRIGGDENEDKTLGQESEVEKYVDCEKFTFKCPNKDCRKDIRFESIFRGMTSEICFTLMGCSECGVSLLTSLNHIYNCLTLFLRKFVTKYYKNEYICEDPTCDNVERSVPFHLVNGYPECGRCRGGLMCKDMRDSHLYKQLSYLYSLFDVEKQIQGLNVIEKGRIQELRRDNDEAKAAARACEVLKAIVSQRLESSGYSEIKLSYIFQGIFPKKDVRQSAFSA